MYASLPALRPLLISTLFAVFTSVLTAEYEVSAFYDPQCSVNDVGHLTGSWNGTVTEISEWEETPHGCCLKFDKALPEGCTVTVSGPRILHDLVVDGERYFSGPIARNQRKTGLSFTKMKIECTVSLGVFD
ncbi:hypothetical protein GGU11DRAFT_803324 [Lentinula aff. detonsa]|nr:hypothetical protein GGU11DRAFT_803324 [Lentinula aff. detonsa]